MNIHIKPSEQRYRPDDPGRDPEYGRAIQAGRKRMDRLESSFESDGQKKDYERQIRQNPNNVPGLPPFYPEQKLRFYMSASGNDSSERLDVKVDDKVWCELNGDGVVIEMDEKWIHVRFAWKDSTYDYLGHPEGKVGYPQLNITKKEGNA